MKNLPEKEICELYLSGKTIGELSIIYNVCRDTIKRRLLKNNIKLRKKWMWNNLKRWREDNPEFMNVIDVQK